MSSAAAWRGAAAGTAACWRAIPGCLREGAKSYAKEKELAEAKKARRQAADITENVLHPLLNDLAGRKYWREALPAVFDDAGYQIEFDTAGHLWTYVAKPVPEPRARPAPARRRGRRHGTAAQGRRGDLAVGAPWRARGGGSRRRPRLARMPVTAILGTPAGGAATVRRGRWGAYPRRFHPGDPRRFHVLGYA